MMLCERMARWRGCWMSWWKFSAAVWNWLLLFRNCCSTHTTGSWTVSSRCTSRTRPSCWSVPSWSRRRLRHQMSKRAAATCPSPCSAPSASSHFPKSYFAASAAAISSAKDAGARTLRHKSFTAFQLVDGIKSFLFRLNSLPSVVLEFWYLLQVWSVWGVQFLLLKTSSYPCWQRRTSRSVTSSNRSQIMSDLIPNSDFAPVPIVTWSYEPRRIKPNASCVTLARRLSGNLLSFAISWQLEILNQWKLKETDEMMN